MSLSRDWIYYELVSPHRDGVIRDKVMAGGTPANPAALVGYLDQALLAASAAGTQPRIQWHEPCPGCLAKYRWW